MTTRILLLTQWFDPEPTFKGLVFARELVRQGFEVEVLTGFPNYPGGKVYPGYRIKWLQREVIDGVQVTRVPLYPDHGQSAIKRVLNYVSFAASSLFYGLFMAKRADVIYAYHPPLTVGITASLLRLLRRMPVVYDIQDMWPESLRASGMLNSERILGIVENVCQWVYKHVDRIVVLSPGFKKLLISRGVEEKKIDVIYNWCDESSLEKASTTLKSQLIDKNYFNILFAGNMGKGQALTSVLDAAEILKDQENKIRFVFLGSGVETDNLKKMAGEKNLHNVIFLPRVPMAEVGPILNAANALIVHLKNDPLFRVTIPSKTQAYMAAGKPILMAVPGDAADLIEQAVCGITAISEDATSIAEAATSLSKLSQENLDEMGEKAQTFYHKNLSMKTGTKKFSKIFHQVSFKK